MGLCQFFVTPMSQFALPAVPAQIIAPPGAKSEVKMAAADWFRVPIPLGVLLIVAAPETPLTYPAANPTWPLGSTNFHGKTALPVVDVKPHVVCDPKR